MVVSHHWEIPFYCYLITLTFCEVATKHCCLLGTPSATIKLNASKAYFLLWALTFVARNFSYLLKKSMFKLLESGFSFGRLSIIQKLWECRKNEVFSILLLSALGQAVGRDHCSSLLLGWPVYFSLLLEHGAAVLAWVRVLFWFWSFFECPKERPGLNVA